jgi:DNA-binding transcriptional MerR regulator
MNQTRDTLLTIGGFASVSFLSIKALRLYDQLGLLTPRYIDPESGYRYYSLDQLQAARLIRTLRQMEMPLASIRRVLVATPAIAELAVRAYVRELEQRAAQAQRLIHDVLAQINQEDGPMTLDVQVRTLGDHPVVSISKHITIDQIETHIDQSIGALYNYVAQQGGSATGSAFGIFHGPVNQEEHGPLEVCLPTSSLLASQGEISAALIPPTQAASVTMLGDQCEFPAILKAYDAAHDWISSNGYATNGSPHEIWHSPPGPDARMEIAWPFREQAQAVE